MKIRVYRIKPGTVGERQYFRDMYDNIAEFDTIKEAVALLRQNGFTKRDIKNTCIFDFSDVGGRRLKLLALRTDLKHQISPQAAWSAM